MQLDHVEPVVQILPEGLGSDGVDQNAIGCGDERTLTRASDRSDPTR